MNNAISWCKSVQLWFTLVVHPGRLGIEAAVASDRLEGKAAFMLSLPFYTKMSLKGSMYSFFSQRCSCNDSPRSL